MENIKMFRGETQEQFCVRILNNPESYGLTQQEAYKMILGKDRELSETETRKRVYGIIDMFEAENSGMLKDFRCADIHDIYEEDNDFEKMNPYDIKILLRENQKLKKSQQVYMDKLKVIRAEDRGSFRIDTIIQKIIDSSLKISENYTRLNPVQKPKRKMNHSKSTAILHFGDWHINKVVNLSHNKFNVEIARNRLSVYFDKVLHELKCRGIHNVIIAMTGDFYNLNKLKDQYLTNEVVRAEALFIGFDVISEFIDVLVAEGFNISFAGVCGNESRFDVFEKQSNCPEIVRDSFDYMLFQQLKRRYGKICQFLNECDRLDYILNVNGKNILLIHGDKIHQSNLSDSVAKTRNKYIEDYKIYVDFMIFGHIHKSQITSDYARVSSLVGSDEYAFNELNMAGNDISQLLHIVTETGDIMTSIINCRHD